MRAMGRHLPCRRGRLWFAVDAATLFALRALLPKEATWETHVKMRGAIVSTVHSTYTVPLVYVLDGFLTAAECERHSSVVNTQEIRRIQMNTLPEGAAADG